VGLVAQFGDKVLAAHQVGLRVESISFMIGRSHTKSYREKGYKVGW